jgi:hypothetical protein
MTFLFDGMKEATGGDVIQPSITVFKALRSGLPEDVSFSRKQINEGAAPLGQKRDDSL